MKKDGAPEPGDGFAPSWLIRHAQIQSILATKSPRRRLWLKRGSRMEAVQQAHVLDCGDGVRLTGLHSRQPEGTAPRGLAVLIHGWEGSHESVYLYSMACVLYQAGYNIFRLNLRDHGGTHALNREMFHSARFDEVLGAMRAIQALDTTQPLYVIGFSLGGNFALRVALRGPAQGVTPRLTIGISPAINPAATIRAIDHGPGLFRAYFLDKWRKTLRAKKAAWPDYDFSVFERTDSLWETTRHFAERFTEYGDMDRYFAAYTLTPQMLMASPAPVAVITAQDDSVIPFADFAGLEARGAVRAYLATARGGHCGFIENLRMSSWAEKRVLELLAAH
ncbi:MAG: alpha/beta fold hydrolase [Nevskiaceae bacterium]|nr:MAG: alpha/beta fold hydrolase [Nevskiaceae bacterium]